MYVLYKLARLALRRGWVKDKNNTIFDRRTGMMTLTWKGKRHAIPFVDLEAGTRHIVNHPGIVRYHLFLYHRSTGMFAQHPAGNEHPWQVEVEWEYMQHFMDISRPCRTCPCSSRSGTRIRLRPNTTGAAAGTRTTGVTWLLKKPRR
ncbi:MAG TPA: hypothetical protein ENI97_14245 [Gammaproteobacteria bacterium]|nr:hypothetical protein [Gammaproteobacteria bacterium]